MEPRRCDRDRCHHTAIGVKSRIGPGGHLLQEWLCTDHAPNGAGLAWSLTRIRIHRPPVARPTVRP